MMIKHPLWRRCIRRTERKGEREDKKKEEGHCAISIFFVMVFKHEISIFICWKIAGKNATRPLSLFVLLILFFCCWCCQCCGDDDDSETELCSAQTVLRTYFNLYTILFISSFALFVFPFAFFSFPSYIPARLSKVSFLHSTRSVWVGSVFVSTSIYRNV